MRPTALSNGITWSNNQLVLNVGAEGTHDTNGVGTPAIVKVDSKYYMWYSGTDAGDQTRILYCDSGDGISWSNHQLVVNLGASGTGHDANGAIGPEVFFESGLFKMYYSGLDSGGNFRTLYAESSDGKSWTNYQLALDLSKIGAGVDDQHAFLPMLHADRLWYTAVSLSTEYRIATCEGASSTPSLTNCQISIDRGNQGTYDTANVASGAVFNDFGLHKVWYSGSTVAFEYDLIYCESGDGISWNNCQLSISRNTLGTIDALRITSSEILVENGVGKMWYQVTDAGNTPRIIYAESF